MFSTDEGDINCIIFKQVKGLGSSEGLADPAKPPDLLNPRMTC